ncbi:hypothetical protein MKW94_029420 [Papaver nudicaule]|uniref:Uncharacterized protein n=1 Tax=Papaver nudicaule TaxID=74823 RepID=A0AA41VHX0_PAPNU|nr:hypothetical protein [Papaver nudicaule]
MMSSVRSQFGLFLFAILALSAYIETSAAALTCAAGESYVETPLIGVFPNGPCDRSLADCDSRCAAQGRTVRYKQCVRVGFLNDWTKCEACCGALPPALPPPSPPPPPPPPPARPAGDRCLPAETSHSKIVASCATGCVRADCVRKCVANDQTDRLAGRCISATGLCSCCCL